MAQVSYPGLVPYCIIPTDVAPSTLPDPPNLLYHSSSYNIGMTAQQLCYFFWNPKNYYMDYNMQVPYIDQNGNKQTNTLSFSGQLYPNANGVAIFGGNLFSPQSETDLVCFDGSSDVYYFTDSTGQNAIIINQQLGNIPATSGYGPYPSCFSYNGLYYPNLIMFGGEGLAFITFDIYGQNSSAPFTATFLGFPITVIVPLGATGYINITADEWPYNP